MKRQVPFFSFRSGTSKMDDVSFTRFKQDLLFDGQKELRHSRLLQLVLHGSLH